MSHNCPVCDKAGLPDYTTQHTICPQCNSDLKPFLLLHSISKASPTKLGKYPVIIFGVIVFALAFFLFNSVSEKNQILKDTSKTNQLFQDTISTLRSALAQQPKEDETNKSTEREVILHYKIKRGDCPSKIAYYFYNDWRMYKKIEEDNGLQQPIILKVGQVLKIKLNRD